MVDFENTLVVTGGGLGDTLFHLPFIRSIQKLAAGKTVILACKKGREIAELFSEIDFVRDVFPIAKDQDVSGQLDFFKLRRLTSQADVKTSFVFHKSSSIAFAMMTAGVSQRYGYYFKGGPNQFFLNKGTCVPREVGRPAFMNHAAMVLDGSGLSYDYNDVRFHQPEKVVEQGFSRLSVDRNMPLVALGINASAEFKQWGAEKYSVMAEKILESYGCNILLFGAADVRHVAEGILAKTQTPERFVDLTTHLVPLNISHGLLQSCAAYVGNDSFGLNLASMSNIPAIGIFVDGHHFSYSDWIQVVNSESSDIHEITPGMVWQEFRKLNLEIV